MPLDIQSKFGGCSDCCGICKPPIYPERTRVVIEVSGVTGSASNGTGSCANPTANCSGLNGRYNKYGPAGEFFATGQDGDSTIYVARTFLDFEGFRTARATLTIWDPPIERSEDLHEVCRVALAELQPNGLTGKAGGTLQRFEEHPNQWFPSGVSICCSFAAANAIPYYVIRVPAA